MLEQMSQDGVDTDSIIFDILEFAHQYERLSLRHLGYSQQASNLLPRSRRKM